MPGFPDYVEHLDPCFNMPTRKTVKDVGLRDMYNIVTGKIKKILKKVPHLNSSFNSS